MVSKTTKREPLGLPRLAINQKEFAQRMGVSVPTARAMMNREGFPTIQAGRFRLIPIAALDRWLEEQAAGMR